MFDFITAYKVILFWMIFYVTPGPVWVSIMEATRSKNWRVIFGFFVKMFLPVNVSIQLSQAIISVIFIDTVMAFFMKTGVIFYFLGGGYICYLAYKVLRSKQKNTSLNLTLANLMMVMLLSPKIWLLFPSGAVIVRNLSSSLFVNTVFFAVTMLLTSSAFFFFYVVVGKVGFKLLQDNFSYVVFVMLTIFGVFLFIEGFTLFLNTS